MTGNGVDELLQAGLAHHRAGRGDAASECYQKILETTPKHADANHLLGVIALQAERWDEAEKLIETALASNDQSAPFHDHMGVIRRNLGDIVEAEAAHRRALALDPKAASAHNNLATTLRQAGRMNEARDAAKRAIAAAPNDPVIAANAGALFMETKAFASAVDAFAVAAAAKPENAAFHEKHGIALLRAGQMEEAASAFRRSLDCAPDHPLARRWLAEVLLMAERADEALAEVRMQLAAHPDDQAARILLGVSSWRAGDVAGAEAAYAEVLADAPETTSALTGLAIIQASRGDTDGAVATYRRVLEIDPDHVDAYGNLAMLDGNGLNNLDAAHLAAMLQRKALHEEQRATVAFALAHYLNRVGEHAAAFDWYRTGNLLRGAHFQAVDRRFDAARHDTLVDARRSIFTKAFLGARQGFGSTSERPVFVVGMPRSGTTLVEQILAAHPDVHGAGELRNMAVVALRRLPTLTGGDVPYPECAGNVPAAGVAALAEEYLSGLADVAEKAGDGDAARIIDKMPFNYLHLGLIHLLLPNARIIHCRRDMRDVGLSCFTTNFADAHPWSADMEDIARYINTYERLMAHWREVLPKGVMTEIAYEDLVVDQEGESRRLVAFIGLDWDETCLAFHQSDRVVMTASRAQVRRPIYAGSIGRWKTF
ncbi:MAG: tetratricopeptide repeat protein, partial [Rhodospirillaceae bacterium]|nr:tetratricopeptide repeat protein [Rhodospirillaceae bacterium]